MEALSRAELDRFRAIIAECLGLQFDDGKLEFLADTFQQRVHARRLGNADYLARLSRTNADELRALACHLTVTETYFFRTPEHWQALAELALPDRIRARASSRRLRLLSAGCASGEEPYTLAILIRQRFPELASWDLLIVGVDLNTTMLSRAAAARYSVWSLRQTPPKVRAQYFHADGREFALDRSIRGMVSFEEGNLAGSAGPLSREGGFDIVLCRNVIMYLAPDAVRRVIASLTRAVAPSGYLFLSHAETLRGLSQDFHLRHTHGAFYYQKQEADMGAPAPPLPEVEPLVEAAGGAWVDAVRLASEHIQRLSDQPSQAAPQPARPNRARSAPIQLGMIMELLRDERFREALALLDGLPPEAAADPDTQLLRAVLLTNCGEIPEAESVCRQILSRDDLNAGAHYVAALCREFAGDIGAAMQHDRQAIYLDSAFGMPRLHLGRLARRGGDLATARRELNEAGVLLLRDDSSRILLFGGGFSREALAAFSRAELLACGGSS